MAADWLKPGQSVAGRWQVIELAGRGALGEVYVVRNTENGELFALKLLGAGFVQIPSAWLSFRKCIETANALGLEEIAKTRDLGIDPLLTMPFVVSERMVWPSLARHVAESSVVGPVRWARALGALAPVLDAAHAAGCVHRGLTPQNLFIDPLNPARLRITDFGMSLLRAALPPPPGWGGVPGWVAPEAATPSTPSTPAMDVFSLGLITFYALTGLSAFSALRREPLDAALLWNEMMTPVGSASDRARELGAHLDARFDPWFSRALAPDPAQRFASPGQMANEFHNEVRRAGITESVPPRLLSLRPSDEHEPVALVSAQPLAYLRDSALPRRAPAPPAAAGSPKVPANAAPDSRRVPLGALVIGGAALVLGGLLVGYVVSGRHKKSALTPEHAPSSSSSALAAAPPSPQNTAQTPAAAASAPPEARPLKTRVTFRCTPPCNRIICDGRLIVADGGALLEPGEHYCVTNAYGYHTHVDRFDVVGGQPTERDIKLHKIITRTRRPAHRVHHATQARPAAKCGTFIHPCK